MCVCVCVVPPRLFLFRVLVSSDRRRVVCVARVVVLPGVWFSYIRVLLRSCRCCCPGVVSCVFVCGRVALQWLAGVMVCCGLYVSFVFVFGVCVVNVLLVSFSSCGFAA